MKKSELKAIIKEEIAKMYGSDDAIQKGVERAFRFTPPTNSPGNILRPGKIEVWFTDRGGYYKTLVDGTTKGRAESEELLKRLTKLEDISLRIMDETKLEEIRNLLKAKNVDFDWNDSVDIS